METRLIQISAHSFVTGELIQHIPISIHSHQHNDQKAIRTVIAKSGCITLKISATGEISFRFGDSFGGLYHPTRKTGIILKDLKADKPDPQDNVVVQVCDWLTVYAFALTMGTPPNKKGYMQAVAATVTEANTKLRDFPHGLPGVKVTLKFDDRRIQNAWKEEQKKNATYKKRNRRLDQATYLFSLIALSITYYATKKFCRALAFGAATKLISSAIAWRFLKAAVTIFYWAAFKRGYLAGYTDPTDDSLEETSRDGGVLFNLCNLNLPMNGASYTLTALKPGYVFKPLRGRVFPDELDIHTMPHTLQAEPHENDAPKIKSDELEEKGRPIRLLKSLTIGASVALLTYYKTKCILQACRNGALTAPTALFILEGLYKKTINPFTIFGAPEITKKTTIAAPKTPDFKIIITPATS